MKLKSRIGWRGCFVIFTQRCEDCGQDFCLEFAAKRMSFLDKFDGTRVYYRYLKDYLCSDCRPRVLSDGL